MGVRGVPSVRDDLAGQSIGSAMCGSSVGECAIAVTRGGNPTRRPL